MQHNNGRTHLGAARACAALCSTLAIWAGADASAAPKETVLHSFCSSPNCVDGLGPVGSLIADGKGNLYGATKFGGGAGFGTVFELSPPATSPGAWTESVLLSFSCVLACNAGGPPSAGLVADSKGNLFGTAASQTSSQIGNVFELSPPASPGGFWMAARLYVFSLSSRSDGQPYGGLIADNQGNLYGTTSGDFFGNDTVFELSPPPAGSSAWIKTTLHEFPPTCFSMICNDGESPLAGLIFDSRGNLYGTTSAGGISGGGTVFELSPPATQGGAWTENVLYKFCNLPDCSDGMDPVAGLIADSGGNLYGTTEYGGAFGSGTVFELSPPATPGGAWIETVLYNFCSSPNCSDGAGPRAALIADSEGNLFGTTAYGGAFNKGVAFELLKPVAPGGKRQIRIAHSFAGGSDGAFPEASLLADSQGNLYGTASEGGGSGCSGSGCGVAFELTGTDFVASIPFSAFNAQLLLDLGSNPADGTFLLFSEFTLGQKSRAINPPGEPVTLKIGTFTATIPAGSFKGSGFGPYYFIGAVNGVNLEVGIVPTGAKRYVFVATGKKADLTGTSNPVPVTISIGADTGTTSANAGVFAQRPHS